MILASSKNFTEVLMRKPTFMGFFHFITIIVFLISAFLIIEFLKKENKKKHNIFFIIMLLLLFIVEILKHYSLNKTHHYLEKNYSLFVILLSSTPFFALLAALIIPNKRIKNISFLYLSTFSLIGSSFALIIPYNVFSNYIFYNVIITINLLLGAILGLYVAKINENINLKDFIYAFFIFLAFIFIGIIINSVTYRNASKTSKDIFIFVFESFSYLFIFPALSYVAFYLIKNKEKLKNYKDKLLNNHYKKGTISIFILVTFSFIYAVMTSLIATNYFLNTTLFYNIGLGKKLIAFICNFAFFIVIGILSFLIIRNIKGRIITLILLSFIFSFLLYGFMIFAKYYNTIILGEALSIAKNESGDMGKNVGINYLLEFITESHIRFFIPSFIMLSLGVFLIKKVKVNHYAKVSGKGSLIITILTSLLLLIPIPWLASINNSKNNPLSYTQKNVYVMQNSGLFNFYALKIFNYIKPNKEIKGNSENTNIYNKNKEKYINVFGETYSNKLKISDTNNLQIDQSLVNGAYLNGVLENKNLFFIQLETFPYFFLGLPEDKENGNILSEYNLFPNLKMLLEESYVLHNFYDSVGFYHSVDSEVATLAGIIPHGIESPFSFNSKYYNIKFSLPNLFKEKGRDTFKIHGDVPRFYNHKNVAKNTFGFDRFYFYDTKKEQENPMNVINAFKDFKDFNNNLINLKYEKLPGLSDIAMIQGLYNLTKNSSKPFFTAPTTLNPHVPFMGYANKKVKFSERNLLSYEGRNFIDTSVYLDIMFKEFITLANNVENAAFVFYHDHGPTGYYKSDLEVIYNKKLTQEEYRRKVKHGLAFVYVPGNELNHNNIKKGLLKGGQKLLRTQIDIYRTIIELFNLNTSYNYYGVNLFSKEHTYSFDPKHSNIYLDDKTLSSQMIFEKRKKNDDYILLKDLWLFKQDLDMFYLNFKK